MTEQASRRNAAICPFRRSGYKVHEATVIYITTAPLLNLNLNYEKLRREFTKIYIFVNIF